MHVGARGRRFSATTTALPATTDQMSSPRFSEAMWFKKGESEDDEAGEPEDATPSPERIAQRYLDDGSLTGGERARYSLRTGSTASELAIGAPSVAHASEGVNALRWLLVVGAIIVLIGIAARVMP
jgi:hypothetical protein